MTDASGFVILPAIDLRGGRVVRLRQGDYTRETAYGDDPVEVAVRFANAGASWLHVVDLDGARTGTPAHAWVIGAIVGAVQGRLRVEAGGGLRDAATVASVLDLGATRAVVGTAALRDPTFAGRLVTSHGRDRIAVSIDVRSGQALGDGWVRDATGVDPVEAIERLADVGIATFEVTAIDRDGLLEGPDLRLYERLVGLGAGSIVASGGIATMQDLDQIRSLGCTGAIVGRAIYEGQFDLHEALAFERTSTSGSDP